MQIDIHNLYFAYGHKTIINNLSLELSQGDYLVIRGKNGTGKSTFVKCLLGINTINSGMIFFDKKDINSFKKWTKFGYLSQIFDDFNFEFPVTVHELLSFASLGRKNEKRILEILDNMGIFEIVNQNMNSLSGGQLQRVFIARALLNNPDVLVLDEPTAAIDKHNREFFYQTVNDLNKAGMTVILVSHNDALDNMNYTHILTMNHDLEYSFVSREEKEDAE